MPHLGTNQQRYLDRKGRYNVPAFRNRFISALDPMAERAEAVETDYLRRAQGFDPRAALRESTGAIWADVREDLGRDLADLGGAAVGAGRLDTGFYDEDQGRLIEQATENFSRAAAERALAAEGLNLRNIEGLGGYATTAQNRYLDMLVGGLDRAEAEAEARRQRRAAMLRGIGTLAGGTIGGLIGGPPGAAAGANMGSQAMAYY